MARADFAAIERAYGLPPGYLHRTMMIESGGRSDAKNPNSSASGPFQFIRSTAKQYGLTDPFDMAASADAAGRLARDNAAHLRRVLGREPSAAELYLAHQQGAGGAAAMLSNPNASAAGMVGRDALRLNAGKDGQTGGGFAQHWINKFNQGYPGAAGGAQAAPQAPQGILPMSMGTPVADPKAGLLAGLLDAYQDTIGAQQQQQQPAPQAPPRPANPYAPVKRDTVAPLLQFFQNLRA